LGSLALGTNTLAALHHGDIDLPEASTRYVLFPERTTGTISASDLI
jgi:hypothetical protein